MLGPMTYGVLSSGGEASTILFQDAFTDTDTTSLDLHTPDIDVAGNGWVETSGTWQISGNKLIEGTTSGALCHADVEDADVSITAKMTIGVDGILRCFSGIAFRIVSASDLWVFRYTGVVNNGAGGWEIREFNPGGNQRDFLQEDINDAQTYQLRVVCDGQLVVCYVDDAEKCRFESASGNETNTVHGLRFGDGDETTKFDDFEVGADPI